MIPNIRRTNTDNLDYYPTPGWATRALFEHVIKPKGTCLEPACGEYYMSKILEEYNLEVTSKDLIYGNDFLKDKYKDENYDWVITNPPFKFAKEFVLKALEMSNIGCAFFLRQGFLESKNRYEELFKNNPPSIIGQFTERVALVKNKVDKNAGSAVSYIWVVWLKHSLNNFENTNFIFIPPCKKYLEKNEDYLK